MVTMSIYFILGKTISDEVKHLEEFALKSTHIALHYQKLTQFMLLTWQKLYLMLIKVKKTSLVSFKQCIKRMHPTKTKRGKKYC